MEENAPRAGGPPLGEAGAAANNADLWTSYFRERVRMWIDPFGIGDPRVVDTVARPVADIAAMVVSGWMSAFVARPTAALYRQNAPGVDKFVAEQAIDPDAIEIPPQFTVLSGRPSAPFAPTQTEEWALAPAPRREPALTR